MLEVPKEPKTVDDKTDKILEHRRQFLYEHEFEKQEEIDYIHPNYALNEESKKLTYLLKPISNSRKTYTVRVLNQITFLNMSSHGISRDIIYPLLEEMNLRTLYRTT